MRTHLHTAALALLVLTACEPEIPPRRPLPPPPPASASDASSIEDAPLVDYVYSPVGKRDPFRDPTTVRVGLGTKAVTPGNTNRPLQPTQKFEIDQLKLSFTVTGTASPMAMLLDPRGRGHAVRIGDFVGKNWGKVSHIGREEIFVTETIADQQTGRVYPVNIPMRMPQSEEEKRQKEMLEEDK